MKPSENCEYSWNELSQLILTNGNGNIKEIVALLLVNKLERNNNKKTLWKDEKIYTKTDVKKTYEFFCSKNTVNPFCKKKNCLDILPNHSHCEKTDKERNLEILANFKTCFFVDEWNWITINEWDTIEFISRKNVMEENELEKVIKQEISLIMGDENQGNEKILKAFLRFDYYVKNIEKYLPHSPKFSFIEEKWKNQEERKKWLEENKVWDNYQEAITVTTEKWNFFSSPNTWIPIAIVLALAVIGWLLYRRRKTTKKTGPRFKK